MSKLIKILTEVREYHIAIFGIMSAALALVLNTVPVGIMIPFTDVYAIRLDYFGVVIIVGLFIKVLAKGRLWLRLIGVAPYTVFVVLAVSLWLRGFTGLLQSQIHFVIFWLLLCRKLIIDLLTIVAGGWDERQDAQKTS
jgi:hypothetical protein